MSRRLFPALLCTALTTSLCWTAGWSQGGRSRAAEPASSSQREPLFEGLGLRTRKVTTPSADSQRYFDQGLKFLYAFNHDEAIRSFRQAAALDPGCAMAWWGIAIANGPHINNPAVSPASAQAAWDALVRAQQLAQSASPVERALIQAAAARYAQSQPADRTALDRAYADAMRQVWEANPRDADVGSLYAEALMDLHPWDLWTADGQPRDGTTEIVSALEEVLKVEPDHPLAIHLYIHAVEASPHPEKADAPADRLRTLQPGLAHLVHMPSHIDVLRGRWQEAVAANESAIAADRKYRQIRPEQGFYNLYMIHNHHMLAYAAMMRGQSARAIEAADTMIASLPVDWVKANALRAEGLLAMPLEVRMRFGKWDEILSAPELPEWAPLARALRLAARTVAYAAQGQVAEARAERDRFLAAKMLVPAQTSIGHSSASALLDLAGHMVRGELLYREDKVEEAVAELREAVSCEDSLRYDEPPDWVVPVRHTLGATLMQAGRSAEAERVYRDDLARWPENGWSLFGLAQSLKKQGKSQAAADLEARFAKVWKDADVTLRSSCFCQPGI